MCAGWRVKPQLGQGGPGSPVRKAAETRLPACHPPSPGPPAHRPPPAPPLPTDLEQLGDEALPDEHGGYLVDFNPLPSYPSLPHLPGQAAAPPAPADSAEVGTLGPTALTGDMQRQTLGSARQLCRAA